MIDNPRSRHPLHPAGGRAWGRMGVSCGVAGSCYDGCRTGCRRVGWARSNRKDTAMLTTPLGRFRLVAFWEGLSFLILLLVAMPLKYKLGMPQAVRAVGMAHGVLFIAYLFTLMTAALERRWGFKRGTGGFLASLVPGGTFWLDAQLRRETREPSVLGAP